MKSAYFMLERPLCLSCCFCFFLLFTYLYYFVVVKTEIKYFLECFLMFYYYHGYKDNSGITFEDTSGRCLVDVLLLLFINITRFVIYFDVLLSRRQKKRRQTYKYFLHK